jgi:hypothetical protein
MKKRIAIGIIGLLLVVGVVAGIKFLQIKTMIAAGGALPHPIATGPGPDRRLGGNAFGGWSVGSRW